MKKRILLKIDTLTYFTSLVRVARVLQTSELFEPVLLLNNDHPSFDDIAQTCEHEGFTFFARLPGTTTTIASPSTDSTKKNPLQRLAVARVVSLYRTYRQRRKLIRAFLQSQAITCIIYGGENAWYDTALYNQVAHRLKIPTFVLPQWMAGPREPAEHVVGNPAYSLTNPFNRLVGWLWPKWALRTPPYQLLRLPGDEVVVRQLLGLAPPLPWILHSGLSTVIAVESQAMFDYGRRVGLPAEQLRVVGSIDHDILATTSNHRDTLRFQLDQELQLTPGQPILLSAVPPDFYSGHRLENGEFTSYHEFLKFWVQTHQEVKKYQTVFHPHPAISDEDRQFIIALGGNLWTHTICELLPLVDLFTASISSTIQWAIACGLPVINFDVYKYRYHDYDAAPGVVTIEKAEDFRHSLQRLTSDQVYYQQLQQAQRAIATDWGVLDGHATSRLIDLLTRLTTNPG